MANTEYFAYPIDIHRSALHRAIMEFIRASLRKVKCLQRTSEHKQNSKMYFLLFNYRYYIIFYHFKYQFFYYWGNILFTKKHTYKGMIKSFQIIINFPTKKMNIIS